MSKRKLEDTDFETGQPTNSKQPRNQDQKSPHKLGTESESKDKPTKTRDTPRKAKHSKQETKQKTPEKGHTESETTKPRDSPAKTKRSKEEAKQKTPEKSRTESEATETRDTPRKRKHSKEEVKHKTPEKAHTESEDDSQATEIKHPEESQKLKSPGKRLKRFTESEIKDCQEKEKQKQISPQKGKSTAKRKKADPPPMKVTSKFVFFYRAQNVFSQFHPAKFVVDGQQYNCMEQYMHYQKAVIFKDSIRAKEILAATDPLNQKKLGRKVENFDKAVWGRKSVVVVKEGSEQKYLQNPEMKKQLFETYPKTLVEASPRDRLWGIGMGASNPLAEDPNNWRGKNLLGYCLTAVRDKLMKAEGLIPKEGNKGTELEGSKSSDGPMDKFLSGSDKNKNIPQ